MAKLIRLGILFGGKSGEHEVSLSSASSVLNTLDPEKYQVTQIGITLEGDWLVGGDVLTALKNRTEENLIPAVMLPTPSRPQIYSLE
ncbi:MAG: D-alanine--D-alanine ligase A, partial [Bacteroidetes bacterium]